MKISEYQVSLGSKWLKCPKPTCNVGGCFVESSDGKLSCLVCNTNCAQLIVTQDTFVDGKLLFGHHLDAAAILMRLYLHAAKFSEHAEHYFPYNYTFADTKNKKRALDYKAEILELLQMLPKNPNDYRRLKASPAVGLAHALLTDFPTMVRVLPSFPKCIDSIGSENGTPNSSSNTIITALKNPAKVKWLQVQGPQDREVTFQRAKAESGSTWAWHGSHTHNWFNIIKTGLRNYSYSEFKKHGAMEGPGIYCGASVALSKSYCRSTILDGKYEYGIAVVEMVKKNLHRNNDIYVVPSEDYVMIRYVAFGEF